MSREAYAPPTLSQSNLNPSSAGTGYGISSEQTGPLTQYLCGDCASKVQLKKGDPIRCKECGHRVLYKERTRR